MLSTLRIQNYGLIEYSELNFTDGLNVLTGETGAGKSMLMDALSLILGKPAQQSFIHNNKDSAWVEAIFEIPSTNKELDSYIEDNQIIVYRKITRSKGNIIRINNQTVTLKTLQTLSKNLAKIIGQHAQLTLLDECTLYNIIDSNCDLNIMDSYKNEYNHYTSLLKQKNSLIKNENDQLERLDFLTYQIEDIKQHNLIEDDEDTLKNEKKRYKQKEEFGKSLSNLDKLCSHTIESINEIKFNIKKLQDDFDSIKVFDNNLLTVSDTIETLSLECSRIANSLTHSPIPIDDIEAKLDIYFKLKQKYRVQSITELLEKYNEMIDQRNSIISHKDIKDELEEEIIRSMKRLLAIATDIHNHRLKRGKEIEKQLDNYLQELEFKGASCKFDITFNSNNFNKYGANGIEFLIRTNQGSQLNSIEKVASGGELSRIMLAITKILNQHSTTTTVYDEIDTGIGGLTGLKIGQFLSDISKTRQVLCVTHLAQVAKYADNHLFINKSVLKDKTTTSVTILKGAEKEDELKRMVGGQDVLSIFN